MKVVVIVLSMSVIATAFTIDDPRLPLRRQRRHPGLFSELLDYGLLDIFQDPNEVYSGTTQEPEDSLAIQARTKREPGLLDGLLDIFKDPSDAPSSYEVPEATSYEVPQVTSYKKPENTYDAPESTYKEPEPTYKEPSYEVPQATSYKEPENTYKEPENTYKEPEPTYDAPESTYKEPEQSYEQPEEPILDINIGVGNEAIIARKKREPGLLDGLADLFKDPSDSSSSSYEVPESTYKEPEPTYKEPSYEVPQATSYKEPENTYDAPESTYDAPEPTYKEPEREPGLLHGLLDIFKDPSDSSSSYEVPQATAYNAPESSYKEPSYQAPASEPDSLLSISIESSQRSS